MGVWWSVPLAALALEALAASTAAAAAANADVALDADVAIIGLGPVGNFLAQLLPAYGVERVLALERSPITYHAPRAVVWDDYTIRAAHAAGEDLSAYMRWMGWIANERWHLKGCASGLRSGLSHQRWNLGCDNIENDRYVRSLQMITSSPPMTPFHQPSWEREMRRRLGALRGVTTSFGTEVLETKAVEGICKIVVRPTDTLGPNRTFWVRFCIATDGGASPVRRQLGLDFEGETFEDQPWVVIDTEVYDKEYLHSSWIGTEGVGFVMKGIDGPMMLHNGEHVSCPFVFVPTQAYFNRWWEEASQEAARGSTDDERRSLRDRAMHKLWASAVLGPKENATPHPVGSGFRFEFLLNKNFNMTEEEAISHEFVMKLLTSCAEVAPSRLNITRKVVYNFHARRASSWRVGPVLLAGDAAHCMPPFQGGGMNSGIKDAANLAWKLALVTRGVAGEALLDSYEPERRTNLDRMTQDSIKLGSQVMDTDPLGTYIRDSVISFMMWIRNTVGVQFTFISPSPNITSSKSITSRGHKLAGELMPAPAVREEGVTILHRQLNLDDLSARAGFTLVLCGGGSVDAYGIRLEPSEDALRILRELGAAVVAVAPAVAGASRVPSSAVPIIAGLASNRRCVDADGHWTEWTRRHDLQGRVLVVRPDLYIFGSFGTVEEAARALEAALPRPPGPAGALRPATP